MYLNKSIIVIHILCYFIIVKSDEVRVYFNDNESLENVYQSEIINTNINIQKVHPLCGYDVSLADTRNVCVATVCNYAYRALHSRNENRNFYVHYSKYDTAEKDICKINEVKLIHTKLPSEMKIFQMMIPCYSQSALTEFREKSQEYRNFLHILVYPMSQSLDSWAVFQPDQINQNYFLKMLLTINNITNNLIPIRLLTLPQPTYSTDKYIIFNELYPFINIWKKVVVLAHATHVLHEVDSNNFGKLCSTILGKPRLNLTVDILKPRLEINLIFLRQPDTIGGYLLEGIMYDCKPFVGGTDFFLFAAPRDNSIIVATADTQNNRYDINQIISNIYLEYLAYIF